MVIPQECMRVVASVGVIPRDQALRVHALAKDSIYSSRRIEGSEKSGIERGAGDSRLAIRAGNTPTCLVRPNLLDSPFVVLNRDVRLKNVSARISNLVEIGRIPGGAERISDRFNELVSRQADHRSRPTGIDIR